MYGRFRGVRRRRSEVEFLSEHIGTCDGVSTNGIVHVRVQGRKDTFSNNQLVFGSSGTSDGIVCFDELAAAGSARIARCRVSWWRWKHTAERVSCCQSSFSAQVVVMDARDWTLEELTTWQLSGTICREASK